MMTDSATTITADSPTAPSHHFDALAQKLIYKAAGEPIHVSVTSSQDGEGVSTIAAELAIACSQTGAKTLLIDANFLAPSQKDRFGLSRTIGLADILHGAASPACIQDTQHEQLSVITAGTDTRRLSTTISAAAFRHMLEGLAERFSVIIIDAPVAAESSVICGQTHGSILVVEAESVRREVVQQACSELESADANILGVVLNKRKQHVPNWLYRRL